MNKILPHNSDAERAVLGAALRSGEALEKILELLTPDDFYMPANREIFVTMAALDNSGKPVDEVTIVEYLGNSKKLKEAGGVTYVTDLRAALPILSNLPHHLQSVQTHSIRRRLAALAANLGEYALDGFKTPDETIAQALDELHAISNEVKNKALIRIDEAAAQAYINLGDEADPRVSRQNEIMKSGFMDLDYFVPRFKPGQLIIIAARPSVGKSTLALNIGINVAKKGGVTAMFSLEMDAVNELAVKAMASEGRADISALSDNKDAWTNLLAGMKKLENIDFWIDDTAGVTVPYIRSKLKRLASRTGKLDLAIVDYLQLLRSPKGSRFNTKNDEVAEISKSLKNLARELCVPIIVLSQLNRDIEKRGNDSERKPRLSDLRDSGAIEQDADIVIMLDRPKQSAYEVANVGVLKNRNGPTGCFELRFDGKYSRFENHSNREEP